jgi:small subunit ribosomal protein S2
LLPGFLLHCRTAAAVGRGSLKPKGVKMAELTLQALLESGAHFGHQTSRWNPLMKKFILASRNGIHLINLEETLRCVEEAKKLVAQIVESGKSVLFVGTKPQAKDTIKESAEACKHFYVNVRWLGGMLTNYATVRKSLKKVEEIDQFEKDGTFNLLPKKEVNSLKKKREKILSFLRGVREMNGLPGIIIVADIIKEHIAVKEANRLNVPVVGIVDTNSDPSKVTNPIPANDDSIKTLQIIFKEFADIIGSTPVKVVKKEEKVEDPSGKRRIVKRKVIKKIIRKKKVKSAQPSAEGPKAPELQEKQDQKAESSEPKSDKETVPAEGKNE